MEEGWATQRDVAQALADQADLGERLASLLISRGLLDPDLAARALGRQHNVPAALLRHLGSRDATVARSLPAEVAHSCAALALAVARDGSVVVCVRDPDHPELQATLERALRRRVTVVVASAHVLEPLVREVYGAPALAFEVDMSFGDDIAALAEAPGFDAFASFSSGAFTLANLDDERVVRDPTQISSGIGRDLDQPTWLARTTTPQPSTPLPALAPAIGRTATPAPSPVSSPAPSPAIARTATPLPTPPPMPAIARTATQRPSASSLPITAPMAALEIPAPPEPPLPADPPLPALDPVAAMAQAQHRDQLLDAAFAALSPRWAAAALFTVKDSAALGQRGFGGQLTPHIVETLVVPLQSPSLLRAAWQRRELASGDVPGAVQERLLRQLGGGPAYAVPIEITGRIVALLLAAGPRDDDAPAALTALARDLGSHLGRLIRATKTAS